MTQGMPPLKCLLTFTTVMERGSFARAADELHVTPSAVSHQIRALETMLGKSLFVRARRSVQPTADAVAYAETIRESFSRIAVATSRFIARAGTRRLRVHSSPSFATLWLLPRLASFQRRHPDIDVSLGAAHEPARLGEDGYMINIQHARPIPEECDGLVLAEETFVPLASPAFVAEHGIESIADIGRVPIIHSIRCVVQWEQWVARFAPDARLNPRSMQFDRSYLAIGAAADGYGLVLESHLHAADFMRRGSLVMPFGPLGVTAVAHRLVYRREDRDIEEISAFVTWIMEEMAGDPSKGTLGTT